MRANVPRSQRITTLRAKLQNSHPAMSQLGGELESKLAEIERVSWNKDKFPLSNATNDVSRSFLQDYYKFLREAKALSSAEQYFISPELSILRKNVNKLRQLKCNYNPLEQDIQIVTHVLHHFAYHFYYLEDIYYGRGNYAKPKFDQIDAQRVSFDASDWLEFFRNAKLLETVGFSDVWKYSRSRLNEIANKASERAKKSDTQEYSRLSFSDQISFDKAWFFSLYTAVARGIAQNELPNLFANKEPECALKIAGNITSIFSLNMTEEKRERITYLMNRSDKFLWVDYGAKELIGKVIKFSRVPQHLPLMKSIVTGTDVLGQRLKEYKYPDYPRAYVALSDMPKNWRAFYR